MPIFYECASLWTSLFCVQKVSKYSFKNVMQDKGTKWLWGMPVYLIFRNIRRQCWPFISLRAPSSELARWAKFVASVSRTRAFRSPGQERNGNKIWEEIQAWYTTRVLGYTMEKQKQTTTFSQAQSTKLNSKIFSNTVYQLEPESFVKEKVTQFYSSTHSDNSQRCKRDIQAAIHALRKMVTVMPTIFCRVELQNNWWLNLMSQCSTGNLKRGR